MAGEDHVGIERPVTPNLDTQIGGFEHDRQFRVAEPVDGVEHVLEPVVGDGPLLLVVEHADHIEGTGNDLGIFEEMDHDRHPGLHI